MTIPYGNTGSGSTRSHTLMLSNFGVNRTGDISNALSECEMQAKEQISHVFFDSTRHEAEFCLNVRLPWYKSAAFSLNMQDLRSRIWKFGTWRIFGYFWMIRLYNPIFLFSCFFVFFSPAFGDKHSCNKIPCCRLQSDPKTKSEDQVGLNR